MFVLSNKAGNVRKTAKTKKERDMYLKLGYIEVVKEETPKEKGDIKNGSGKRNRIKSETDI